MSEEIIPLDESIVSIETEEVVIGQNGNTDDNNNNIIQVNRYKCGICNYSTNRKYNHERHTRVHSDERGSKHSCGICGYSPNDASKVKDHIKVVHDGELFLCVHCGKKFKSKEGVRRHEHINHKNMGKFKCLTCDLPFLSRSAYIGHVAKHSGTKPYKCTVCKTEFRYETNLKRHAKFICQGTKQIKCALCGQQFATRRDVKYHMEGFHEKSKRFRCKCGSRYSWRSSLSYHMQRCPFQK